MGKILETLLEGVEVIEVHGNPRIIIGGLAYDSRLVREGDLFVAIPGTKEDGNRYVQDAIRRGAAGVITENPVGDRSRKTFVRVVNSRHALAALSAGLYDHPSRKITLAGVTGTNGKTTTTLLLESIFQNAGYSTGVIGTLAYRWGDRRRNAPMTTPESLDLQVLLSEMVEDGVSHVVMEVSSHALALSRVRKCAFDAAVFTNLSQDHLDFHGSMEAYFESKRLLYKDCAGWGGKSLVSVINMDDAYGRRLAEEIGCNLWSYSIAGVDARVWVKHADLKRSGIDATLGGAGGDMRIHSPLLGRLNLYNILAAVTAALGLGISREAIVEGVRSVSLVDGRLQRVPIPAAYGFDVVVDYAHTPDAMEKSLGCLREMAGGRLLVVFGCGGDRDRGKRPLMGRVAARLGDLVILTSDNPRTEVPEKILSDIEPGVIAEGLPLVNADPDERAERGYTIEVNRKRAIELALGWARPGDTVFIGGKGHETYQIIGVQTFPFDDRQVVREYFENCGSDGQQVAVGT